MIMKFSEWFSEIDTEDNKIKNCYYQKWKELQNTSN